MGSCGTRNGDMIACNGFHMIRPHTPLQLGGSLSLTWFDMRVFYVRVTNDLIDDSVPESLKINHIPMDPEALLEVNGTRCRTSSDGLSSLLRRDRVDKKSKEVTFVSTDAVRFTGSVKFEVFNGDNLVLSGVLELSGCSDSDEWSLRCKSELVGCTSFLKAKHDAVPEYVMPVIEVYAAGCVSGSPIILTETLQLNARKKKKKKNTNGRQGTLDVIPEHETAQTRKNDDTLKLNAYPSSGLDLQAAGYRSNKMEGEEDLGFNWTREYAEEEDGELSWFNAGVRVGVGIGLGVCLGVGLGAGLLFRTYQTTTRTLKRRFL